jgi:hypothetical protein
MITERQARGWTFVFLSASLEAYEEAGSMGVKNGSRQHFHKNGEGAHSAMLLLSERMTSFRDKRRTTTRCRCAIPYDQGRAR